MQRNRAIELRVGLFVLLTLAVGGTIAALIGGERGLFKAHITYNAVFDSVAGLRSGSTVRVGGVTVGSVEDVVLRRDGKIFVVLDVIEDASNLVREGSVVTIGAKGLLGDRLVDISVGVGAPLASGTTLPSESPTDIGRVMAEAGTLMTRARETVENIRSATAVFQDPEFGGDVRTLTANLARITSLAANGGGVAQALLEDQEIRARFERTLGNAERASAELAALSAGARSIVQEVARGDGTAHELVYGAQGSRLVENLATATAELATLMRDARTHTGLVHELVYAENGAEIVDNVTAMTGDLRAIVADVRAGRGTVGGMLVDPSIYEDVKRLVGNVERNQILRALVRYSVSRAESRETPTVAPASP